jgi:superoxide dismutase, Cu-Zn family
MEAAMIQKYLCAMALTAILSGPAVIWAQSSAPITAVAELSPTQGNTVHGEVKFIQKDGYLLVKASVEGLTPGKHPFHVHEVGDCSAPDASSAGGHFKLSEPQSATPDAKPIDVADLGILNADSAGKAHRTFKDKLLQLSGVDSIIGKAVVVHASDSPARVACGVIQVLQDNK